MSDVLVCIYRITCLTSMKVYIGQTRQPTHVRWRAHVGYAKHQGDDMAIARAIRKYGEAAFKMEPLEYLDVADANKAECAWITHLGCQVPFGYNLDGGGGVKSKHPSTCKKLAESQHQRLMAMPLDVRKAIVAKMHAAMTPEARSERTRRNASMRMTPEQHAMRMQKVNAALTFEKRSETVKKVWASLTSEQLATRSRNIASSLSHDQRLGMAHRAWATRRAKTGGPRCSVEMVDRAATMHTAGNSLSYISKILKVPRATLTKALKDQGLL